jgi:hypothetical protein
MNPTSTLARALQLLAFLLLIAVQTGCGGSDDADQATATTKKKTPTAKPAPGPQGEAALANAVVVGKSVAPVMLKYDLTTKPEVGQPFEIALTFLPRQAADALVAEVTGMPGLTVVTGGAVRFEPVEHNGTYVAKVLANADAEGLYYIGIVAKMESKVQTETRAFSVPVVVGKPAAADAAKPAPATDSAGEPIEELPAKQTTATAAGN